MNRKTFLSRFLLTQQAQRIKLTEKPTTLRKAAVLIALVERERGLHVILTERALHLRHHPGQVSFPGGKYEPFDQSLRQTALRETDEEIGIKAHLIEVIARLAPLKTVSGFEVTPFVGLVDASFELNIDEQEVSSVFEVPLALLLDHKSFYLQHLIANKKRHSTYCIGYQNHLIWGATAQILKNLQTNYSC